MRPKQQRKRESIENKNSMMSKIKFKETKKGKLKLKRKRKGETNGLREKLRGN